MLNHIQYLFLKHMYKLDVQSASSQGNRLSVEQLFGKNFVSSVKDKVVIDYGCGHGHDVEQVAKWNAKVALGIEIREEIVNDNRSRVNIDNCAFETRLPSVYKEKADIVYSIDAFEHFDHPELILHEMRECLKPGGEAWICFGPVWYHPYGGHLFSVFPWAHLILSEKSLVKWRNQYFNDGATQFTEVSGGLNKMTISRFEKIVEKSGFRTEEMNCVPLRGKKILQTLLGREAATAFVFARLVKA